MTLVGPRMGNSLRFLLVTLTSDGIYVINADGSGLIRLTDDSSDNSHPSWSPDGQRIAYHSYRDGDAEIYVMNADGSDQTQLTDNSIWDGEPSWSPDGRRIVYSSGDSLNEDLYLMNSDGSGQTQLTDNSDNLIGRDHSPSWGPAIASVQPNSTPTPTPTPKPTSTATPVPTAIPTIAPTLQPTPVATATPLPITTPIPTQTSQSGSIPGQVPFGDNQTPSGTFEEKNLVRAQQEWIIEVELVLGDRVVVTYTSGIKRGVIFNVIDSIGESIYTGEQAADGGTEFTAKLNGSYELTFLNPLLLSPQEVEVEYQVIPTLKPKATRTPIVRTSTSTVPTRTSSPTRVASTPISSTATPIPTPTPLASARGTSTPAPTQPPSSVVTPTPSPPSPTPAPEPTPERGFFINSLPTQGNSGDWDFMDPVALSIIGITLTLVGTLVQLFRGR